MNENIGLLGNSSQADEVESYLGDNRLVAFRAVSAEYIRPENTKLIDIDQATDYKTAKVIAAVGAPAIKRKMIEKWPGTDYLSVVSEKAIVDKSVSLGMGSVIAPGVVITTNVTIDDHVLLNIGATINHDCKIGSFTTISPGVHIAGNAEIGDGVFVGIGATISNNVKIAAGTVIGAGTVVLEDITVENSVVVGVPGKVIRTNKDWLSEI